MKNRLIAIAVGALALFGVLSFVTFGPPAVFAAESADEYEEGTPGALIEPLLDRLVEQGFISEDTVEELEESLPDEVREFMRRPFRGPDVERFGAFGRDWLEDALDDVTPDELRDAIEDGTLDELIDVDAILESARDAIADAVEEGRITAEQGERLLERLTERLEALEDGDGIGLIERFGFRLLPPDVDLDDLDPRPFLHHGFGWFGGDGFGDLLDDVTPDELRDALEDGTLDEVLDLDEILRSTIAEIEQAVEDGRLTPEQAERMIEHLEQRIDALADGEVGWGLSRGFRFGPWHDDARDGTDDSA